MFQTCSSLFFYCTQRKINWKFFGKENSHWLNWVNGKTIHFWVNCSFKLRLRPKEKQVLTKTFWGTIFESRMWPEEGLQVKSQDNQHIQQAKAVVCHILSLYFALCLHCQSVVSGCILNFVFPIQWFLLKHFSCFLRTQKTENQARYKKFRMD